MLGVDTTYERSYTARYGSPTVDGDVDDPLTDAE